MFWLHLYLSALVYVIFVETEEWGEVKIAATTLVSSLLPPLAVLLPFLAC
jgi:hypothetical protein